LSWQLVESDDALQDLLVEASRHSAVAIDTEFMRRNTFFPQVALLQLCFDDKAWLIDPLAITEIDALIDFMVNPDVVKVLHSASEDLEVFQQWLGVLPAPLFDTQRAAALLGRGFGMGYRALVDDICGVELDKGETRSDWLKRPLTESQCNYAGQDVTHLLTLWHTLSAECEQSDKTQWVFSDGEDAANTLASNAGQYYKKIKSAWKLDERQLASLIAISDWREHTARDKDKPRSWIIDDKACFELAEKSPQDWESLKACEEVPSSSTRRYGEELISVLAATHNASKENALPERLPGPLNSEQRNLLKKVKAEARRIAETLGVAPEAVLPSKDYELLIREAHGESVDVPAHWVRWREHEIVAPLRQFLSGSTS
jgi:ribonuclease D